MGGWRADGSSSAPPHEEPSPARSRRASESRGFRSERSGGARRDLSTRWADAMRPVKDAAALGRNGADALRDAVLRFFADIEARGVPSTADLDTRACASDVLTLVRAANGCAAETPRSEDDAACGRCQSTATAPASTRSSRTSSRRTRSRWTRRWSPCNARTTSPGWRRRARRGTPPARLRPPRRLRTKTPPTRESRRRVGADGRVRVFSRRGDGVFGGARDRRSACVRHGKGLATRRPRRARRRRRSRPGERALGALARGRRRGPRRSAGRARGAELRQAFLGSRSLRRP